MRIFVESFIVLLTSLVILMQIIFLIKKTTKSRFSMNSRKSEHMLFFFALLLLMTHQYKLLESVYRRKLWDYDSNTVMGGIKFLQYIAENALKTAFFVSLCRVLTICDQMKIEGIEESSSIKMALISYGILRLIPAADIFISFSEEVSFSIFKMEVLLMAEDVLIALILTFLIHSLVNIEQGLETSILPEKPLLEYQIDNLMRLLKIFQAAFVIESISRLLFLIVMMENKARYLLFFKDIANLLKILSLYLVISSITDLLFNDTMQDNIISNKTSLKPSKDFKFFIFEDESNDTVVDLKK